MTSDLATPYNKKHNTQKSSWNKIAPQKFALWLACASILMMFTALLSGHIVRQAQGNWLEFELPSLFITNTVVIILSSIALHSSYISFKRGKEFLYKSLLVVAFALGILFLIFQFEAWQQMKIGGVGFTIHPSSDFVFVISGLHAAHILGGIAAITVAMIHAFSLKFKPTNYRRSRFELVLNYWHFVGFLWIFLLGFLIMQQA